MPAIGARRLIKPPQSNLALMPYPARIARLGNSLEQYAHAGGSSSGARPQMKGDLRDPAMALNMTMWNSECTNWRSDDSRQGRYFTGGNHGLSGDTLWPIGANPGLLSRVGEMMAMRPDGIKINEFINTYQNTVASGTAVADAVAGMKAIHDEIRKYPGGQTIPILIENCPPYQSGFGANSNTLRANIVAGNAALAAAMPSWGQWGTRLGLMDAFSIIFDGQDPALFAATSGTVYPDAKWFFDGGVHTGPQASFALAKLEKAFFEPRSTPGNRFADLWARGGNIHINPRHTGLTGTKSGGVTGTGPTGLATVGPGSSSSFVASMEANPDIDGYSCVVDCTIASSVSTSELLKWQWNTFPGGQSNFAGKSGWVMAFSEIEIDASGMMASCEQLLSSLPSSVNWDNSCTSSDYNTRSGSHFPFEAGTYIIPSNPVYLDGTTTDCKLTIQPRFVPAYRYGTCRVKLKRTWVGNISDPRIAWHAL